jgi:hypothetical protein
MGIGVVVLEVKEMMYMQMMTIIIRCARERVRSICFKNTPTNTPNTPG